MANEPSGLAIDPAVEDLKSSYPEYMRSLGRVRDQGGRVIPALIEALGDRRANPIAIALGLLMNHPGAVDAIPPLLDCLIGQSPIYPDALEALVRAGDRSTPHLIDRLGRAAADGDDEAVRNLLDLGARLPEKSVRRLIPEIETLLSDSNPHVREAAVDSIGRIGPPLAKLAESAVRKLADDDSEPFVRDSAREALTRLGGG